MGGTKEGNIAVLARAALVDLDDEVSRSVLRTKGEKLAKDCGVSRKQLMALTCSGSASGAGLLSPTKRIRGIRMGVHRARAESESLRPVCPHRTAPACGQPRRCSRPASALRSSEDVVDHQFWMPKRSRSSTPASRALAGAAGHALRMSPAGCSRGFTGNAYPEPQEPQELVEAVSNHHGTDLGPARRDLPRQQGAKSQGNRDIWTSDLRRRYDAARDSDLAIALAMKQVASDTQVLTQSTTADDSACDGKQTIERIQRVQAALQRQTVQKGLVQLEAQRGLLEAQLAAAKSKVRDVESEHKHLQLNLETLGKDNRQLLASNTQLERKIDSMEASLCQVAALVEVTMQHIHAHTRRVMEQQDRQVTEARGQRAEAERVSKQVVQLKAERDAACQTITQQQKEIEALSTELLECSSSADDLRYEKDCALEEVQSRHQREVQGLQREISLLRERIQDQSLIKGLALGNLQIDVPAYSMPTQDSEEDPQLHIAALQAGFETEQDQINHLRSQLAALKGDHKAKSKDEELKRRQEAERLWYLERDRAVERERQKELGTHQVHPGTEA